MWNRLLLLLFLRQSLQWAPSLLPRSSRGGERNLSLQSSSSTMASTSDAAPGVTLTPEQILIPFGLGTSHTPKPLHVALEQLRSAVASLQTNPQPLAGRLVRIQQELSSARDPLAWLHAQLRAPLSRVRDEPVVYLGSLETDLEVASVGSAIGLSSTLDLASMLDALPHNSRWYGGARFDAEAPVMGDDWAEFGNAYWMLPRLELRRSGAQSTLAVHVVADEQGSFTTSLTALQELLNRVDERSSALTAPTTLPPILSRDSNYGGGVDGQELYESGVTAALAQLNSSRLEKVVLARQQRIQLGVEDWSALELIRRWKYGGHEGGHLFYLKPRRDEFFGCTPERLFQVADGHVRSEALAGTRPRGSTQSADEALLQDLFASDKDRRENLLTGRYIESAFEELSQREWVDWKRPAGDSFRLSLTSANSTSGFFVRRLRHLQHICQRYSAPMTKKARAADVTQFLWERLHPTPAVCGLPMEAAREFIRQQESIGFDRGFYSGPVGYIGQDEADMFVAIRSGLAKRTRGEGTSVLMYAGAGIVPGSTLQGEWAETNYKLAVISSLFPQSPMTLHSAPTPNVAWATAFVEELIRNGVTQFYVCPGSRSTPLVVAIAKAVRSHVGIVNAISVHDERSAGFRALGWARGAGRPAAVITSSGTAVANLYPAVVEASMDGVPLLVLTADRPYESRDTGANQAIDQVKLFSGSYVRWFRDVLPPDDQVPISVALSDAAHAVSVSRELKGPVHVNMQFRENLSPDAGPIRNDGRVDAVTRFNGFRFTDAVGYKRWSRTGGRWSVFSSSNQGADLRYAQEVARLIASSKRGIIVVGNLREPTADHEHGDYTDLLDSISAFALSIGFPILAGAQCAALRFRSPAVVPFAEHLLKCPAIVDNLNPDLVIQIGAPLVSTAIPSMVKAALRRDDGEVHHVLIHPHSPRERVDPEFTVSLAVSAEVSPFLKAVSTSVREAESMSGALHSSDLASLVALGRKLRPEMKAIIKDAARVAALNGEQLLTEPELVLAIAEDIAKEGSIRSLFLSNSMPVRDCEFFLYPFGNEGLSAGLSRVGTNRGASGIDGIIASATGFAEATGRPTTLLIGDLAALHDINTLHSLSNEPEASSQTMRKFTPLTTIIVNNDGGGIFSFLPIANHGSDVSFEEFFGTPTRSFSFCLGAEAFGLPVSVVSAFSSFSEALSRAKEAKKHSVIEARVAGRNQNVAVHQEISKMTTNVITSLLQRSRLTKIQRLPVKVYYRGDVSSRERKDEKTLVLLHGWMGEKSEWDDTATLLLDKLTTDWRIISVDLPGHGESPNLFAPEIEVMQADADKQEAPDLEFIATTVLRSLSQHHAVHRIDAIAGYSLGGRIAMTMKRLCQSPDSLLPPLVTDSTHMVLVSANPSIAACEICQEGEARGESDERLSSLILALSNRASLLSPFSRTANDLWAPFLDKWYSASLWGNLMGRLDAKKMIQSRTKTLNMRARDLAAVLKHCSPALSVQNEAHLLDASRVLFISGALDSKYTLMGTALRESFGVQSEVLPDVGHSLLIEAPSLLAQILDNFLSQEAVLERSPAISLVKPDASEDLSVPVASSEAAFQPSAAESLASFVRQEDTAEGDTLTIGLLEIEAFTIDLVDRQRQKSKVFGIGWGERAAADDSSGQSIRNGLVIQLAFNRGVEVGIGEISPLPGFHNESLDEAKEQLESLMRSLARKDGQPQFEAKKLLRMDGSLRGYLQELAAFAGVDSFLPCVHAGLEMALMSLASQALGLPVHRALQSALGRRPVPSLAINGLITRFGDESSRVFAARLDGPTFPSVKVKVGHQSLSKDALVMSQAFRMSGLYDGSKPGNIRADANRAWNESEAMEFASALDGIELHSVDRLEFIEEPLEQQARGQAKSQIHAQVEALERWYRHTGIRYALDETIADLVQEHGNEFGLVREALLDVFADGSRGCAAFVLKPALLGMELSFRIAELARSEIGVGAVFSSSFDSGIGLAFTSLLGSCTDTLKGSAPTYPHGVGTFTLLGVDTLDPPFSSYVNENGVLNTASLSRALFGLSLDDMRDLMTLEAGSPPIRVPSETRDANYEASTATSSSGKEISVVVSLPLPFSVDIAHSRFTDLPQHSRWSPWISSVAYQGKETEWTLNVRGIPIKWRATSQLLQSPLGIQWQSVSGLKNEGKVEFTPDGTDKCTMNVQMTILVPRLLRPLFQGTTLFLEDFLRDKLLKWSLEMFRDVVKADLALERGDVELGDALYGAVEGKASAIEATLNGASINSEQSNDFD